MLFTHTYKISKLFLLCCIALISISSAVYASDQKNKSPQEANQVKMECEQLIQKVKVEYEQLIQKREKLLKQLKRPAFITFTSMFSAMGCLALIMSGAITNEPTRALFAAGSIIASGSAMIAIILLTVRSAQIKRVNIALLRLGLSTLSMIKHNL